MGRNLCGDLNWRMGGMIKMKTYTVGILKKNGEVTGKAFESKEEADTYILELAEKEELKQAKIRNLITGEEEIINF